MTQDRNTQIAEQYYRGGLLDTLLNALAAAGKDVDALQPDDLTPLEEFHVGARPATLALAELADIQQGDHVLDIGCGIGGPARALAVTAGCRVTGVDLSAEYCEVATALSSRVGLDNLEFKQGDALNLPFEDETFDVVWTQHASMNIEDKPSLYREYRRVLKSGGRVAIHDIAAGPVGDVHFPVPWASEPSISFLSTQDQTRGFLEDAGLSVDAWEDTSQEAFDLLLTLRGKLQALGGPPPLGLHVLVGPSMTEKGANMFRNIAEKRIMLFRAVARAS
jgi:SAM-dependent methyltransferase